MRRATQGFTLIELLIIIAIVGILAAVLIPNMLWAARLHGPGELKCYSIETATGTYYTRYYSTAHSGMSIMFTDLQGNERMVTSGATISRAACR